MPSKTLIYSNTGLSSWQIGINTEVIDKLNQDEERELLIVNCSGVLTNCYFNQLKNPIGCAICQSRQKKLLQYANIDNTSIVPLEDVLPNYLSLPYFTSLEELMEYCYEGYNIGRGAASSIISSLRDYSIDPDKHQSLIEVELKKSINVLLYMRNFIEQHSPSDIYLFNGRFSEVWPLVLLAEEKNIDYYCIESGSPDKYQLFKNALPHSIQGRHDAMIFHWKSGSEDRASLAQKWFDNRRNKTNHKEIQFTLDQQLNQLPNDFDPHKRNVVLFNSSEDELKAIKEWENSCYSHQNEAIATIAKHYQNKDNIHFYLRVHPNLRDIHNTQTKQIKEFNFPNLTIIPAEDTVDTYYIMDACDIVISFGSTTGIEATYWGNASILFGNSTYNHLNAVYKPESWEELYSLIGNPDLQPMAKENTYPFGHYFAVYGTPPDYFKHKRLTESYYRDQKLKRIYPLAFFQNLIKYTKYIPLWMRLLRARAIKMTPRALFTFK